MCQTRVHYHFVHFSRYSSGVMRREAEKTRKNVIWVPKAAASATSRVDSAVEWRSNSACSNCRARSASCTVCPNAAGKTRTRYERLTARDWGISDMREAEDRA